MGFIIEEPKYKFQFLANPGSQYETYRLCWVSEAVSMSVLFSKDDIGQTRFRVVIWDDGEEAELVCPEEWTDRVDEIVERDGVDRETAEGILGESCMEYETFQTVYDHDPWIIIREAVECWQTINRIAKVVL